MRYAVLIYRDEETAVSDREKAASRVTFTAILDGLRAFGVLAGTQHSGCAARAARIVRCRDGGDIIVTDGPAAQTSEQLTGWGIAECEDLDGALRRATTISAAWYGSVEVRPAGETLT